MNSKDNNICIANQENHVDIICQFNKIQVLSAVNCNHWMYFSKYNNEVYIKNVRHHYNVNINTRMYH